MISPKFRIVEKNPEGFARFKAELREMDGAFVKVGFPSGAKPGDPGKTGSGSKPYSNMSEVARVAVWNEFGVPMKSRVKKLGNTGKAGKYLSMQENTAGLKSWNKGFWFIVPRPFFRKAVDTNKQGLGEMVDRTAADFLRGKIGPKTALERIGIWMQDKIKRSITTGNWAPNAPRTKEKKGSSKPLIDKQQMRNSVTFTTHRAGEPCEREGTVVVL